MSVGASAVVSSAHPQGGQIQRPNVQNIRGHRLLSKRNVRPRFQKGVQKNGHATRCRMGLHLEVEAAASGFKAQKTRNDGAREASVSSTSLD